MNFDVTVNGKPWRVAIEASDTQGPAQVSIVTIRGRRRSYDVSWVDAGTLSLIPLNDEKQGQEFGIEAAGGGELQVTARGRTFRATVLSDGKSHQRHPHRVERA